MGNVEKILVAVIMTTIVVILALAIYGLGTDPGYLPDEGDVDAVEAEAGQDPPGLASNGREIPVASPQGEGQTGSEMSSFNEFLDTTEEQETSETFDLPTGGPEEVLSEMDEAPEDGAEKSPSTWSSLPSSPIEGMKVYEVRNGDSLSTIAERFYAKSSAWRLILSYNKDINPDKLRVGAQLLLPAPGSTTPTQAVPQKKKVFGNTYLVKKGDTLYGIARNVLSDEKRWRAIYNENRHILSAPGDLREGMALRLPQ